MRTESSQSAPRRTRVKGHPGIFVRESTRGRRYEITFVGSDGRRRWRTIEGNLADADAALAKVKTQLHAGERVLPTTATVAEVAEACSQRLASCARARLSVTRRTYGYTSFLESAVSGSLP
jgi:hypothetical protein